ncbi:hypothetical protein STSP2_01763 [Anaerohalosphaera lusitana]|uniref:DUF2007 domain-containing protein n=1 Tax=Anaerohalosphaera lusitana TaxID=1936003 RepID=A0A1U9NL90_9BACT|nr:hypothetical protein [Anaerohalosphaera lusitana]AQT68595.1 hypothetical protein STSP2_01763 [Anaerohalosphaera lusitana]
MSSKRKNTRSRGYVAVDYVTVAFAEDRELARQYEELLAANGISAAIKKQDGTEFGSYAVLVSEENLEEAHYMIESERSMDTLFDISFGDDAFTDLEADTDFD